MSRVVALAFSLAPVVVSVLTLVVGLFRVAIAAEPCPPADGC